MQKQHTAVGANLTDLILETFRLNGALLAAGDELVRDLGLTSARWQVLGALALAGRPLTVAQIGRRMGISRQAVQRLVNDLVREGHLVLEDNPDHRRSRLAALTRQGRNAYDKADGRQIDWVNSLGAGLEAREVAAAVTVLKSVNERVERDAYSETGETRETRGVPERARLANLDGKPT